jgi:hypothetical protein
MGSPRSGNPSNNRCDDSDGFSEQNPFLRFLAMVVLLQPKQSMSANLNGNVGLRTSGKQRGVGVAATFFKGVQQTEALFQRV